MAFFRRGPKDGKKKRPSQNSAVQAQEFCRLPPKVVDRLSDQLRRFITETGKIIPVA
jgi:ribosomal protein S18